MTTSTNTYQRRTIVKGAAWAAPVVLASAAVPAYAASKCGTPTVRFSGGVNINYGYVATSSTDTQTTDMQLAFGGQVYVDNLPAGVTVTKVTEQWFIENHQGQTTKGNGMFFMGNVSTNYYKNGTCTATGCSVTWTKLPNLVNSPNLTNSSTAPGAGWSSTVKNTQNNTAVVYSDGVTRNAWDATLSTLPGAGTYTPTTSGCQNYTTGPSGKFAVNYSNITRQLPGTTVATFAIVTVTLSTGQVLTYRTSTQFTPAPAA